MAETELSNSELETSHKARAGSGLSRRQFLQLAGAAGVLGLPTLVGYRLLEDAEGELPVSSSPYTSVAAQQPSPPAAPILVLSNTAAQNPFGTYLAEILLAEGMNYFHHTSLSSLDSATLERFDLILLAEGPLNQSQVEMLEGFVAQGGRLIAMRPDARLCPLLGLERVPGSTSDGYLELGTGPDPEPYLSNGPLQFHGEADHYRLAGAEAVAWLVMGKGERDSFPAVTTHRFGEGRAAMWSFDLAHSVVYSRQGNPQWANQERDGRPGIRAHDAFVDWIDLDRIAVPQADEQMRLLSWLMARLLADVRPLPRLWYFPHAAKTMLIATGDSHGNPAYSIDEVLTRVERHGGHMTVYYAPPHASDLRRALRKLRWWAAGLPVIGAPVANEQGFPSPADVARWRSHGHEFTFHPFVDQGVAAGIRDSWQEFTGSGYNSPSPTVRTHRVLWEGWVETARVQAGYGLRMNLDFYHIGPAFRSEDGAWKFGYFTGSGLPMRFADEQGHILNIYQQLTQLVDEHLFEVPWGSHMYLSAAEAVEVSEMVLQRSLAGGYSAIGAQFHIDPFALGGDYATRATRWLEGTLDYAAAQGVPIWSAADWLGFTEARHATMLADMQWDTAARRLTFRLEAERAPEIALSLLIPLRHGTAQLDQIKVGGQVTPYREQELGGERFACVTVGAGSQRVDAIYV